MSEEHSGPSRAADSASARLADSEGSAGCYYFGGLKLFAAVVLWATSICSSAFALGICPDLADASVSRVSSNWH
jgi:hypothetical protein